MNIQKTLFAPLLILLFASANALVGEIEGKERNTKGDEIFKAKHFEIMRLIAGFKRNLL